MIKEKILYKNILFIKKNLIKKKFFFNKLYLKEIFIKKKNIYKNFNLINRKIILKKLIKKYKIIESYFLNKFLKIYKLFFKKINYKTKNFISKIPNLINKNNYKCLSNKKIKNKKIKNIKKNHIEIGSKYGLDFKTGENISDYGFEIIKNPLSKLYRSLIKLIIDIHVEEHNYKEILIPYIVSYNSMINSGQIPKFINNLFKIKYKKEFKYLIPTSEISLINILKNNILNSKVLPIKFLSHSKCFRKESKSYGNENKGLIRRFQFDKIELIYFTNQKNSYKDLNELIKHIEKILKILKLPYRIILLCKKNIGMTSSKTFDIEVWLPSLNNFCEISSCSNIENFQSIKLKNKYNYKKKIKFTHILNGSGVAIGRTLACILEIFQKKNGYLKIPKILKDYMKKKLFLKF